MEKVSTKSPQKIRKNAVDGEQEEVVTKDHTIEAQNNGQITFKIWIADLGLKPQ